MQYLRVPKCFDLTPNVNPVSQYSRNSVKTFVKRLFCYRPMNLCNKFGAYPRCVNSVNHDVTFSARTRLCRERILCHDEYKYEQVGNGLYLVLNVRYQDVHYCHQDGRRVN